MVEKHEKLKAIIFFISTDSKKSAEDFIFRNEIKPAKYLECLSKSFWGIYILNLKYCMKISEPLWKD